MDPFEVVKRLVIRAAPFPKPCYICRADKNFCVRYVIPSIYWLTDIYTFTGNMELLKNIKAFWLCTEHYAWFDQMDRRNHWRDLNTDMIIKSINSDGEKSANLALNTAISTDNKQYNDYSSLANDERFRVIEICSEIKSSLSIISSAFNNILPYISTNRGENDGFKGL